MAARRPPPATTAAAAGFPPQSRPMCHVAAYATPDPTSAARRRCIALLQSCIDAGSIADARRLHSALGDVVDAFVGAKLVSACAKCGSLEDARRVFDGMTDRNLFAWTAMINAYERAGRWHDVLRLFAAMAGGGVIPDPFVITRALQACANIGDLAFGKSLHALALRLGILAQPDNAFVSNSVLAMYAKSGELRSAEQLFRRAECRDLVSWNSMISGHCQWGDMEEALGLFEQMRLEGVEPGVVTWNVLIASYSKSGDLDTAMTLTDEMKLSGVAPDVYTWTSLISGFVQHDKPEVAFGLFHKMRQSGVEPNEMTILSMLSACAALRRLGWGRELHGYAAKLGHASGALLVNSLVDMYAKCGSLAEARSAFDAAEGKDVCSWNSLIAAYTQAGLCSKAFELFSEMERRGALRNVVTWNAMISGYLRNGDEDRTVELLRRMEANGVERDAATWNALIAGSVHNGDADGALRVFRRMQAVHVPPNAVTYLSILPACGNLLSGSRTKEMHGSILRRGLHDVTPVANALLDAYARSGDLASSRAVFDGIARKGIVSWNAIISATVAHGDVDGAMELFARMASEGVRLDHTTFVAVIRAYALAGRVSEGKQMFVDMEADHGVTPTLEHYAAMVELFGRSGRLGEASEFIDRMPIPPDSTVWNALLTASTVHGHAQLARRAGKKLFKPGLQTLPTGTHDTAMPKRRKPDSCWLETRNGTRCFSIGVAGGLEHEVALVESTTGRSCADQEAPEMIHCERRAVAHEVMNSAPGRAIKVVKAEKMCRHCHVLVSSVSAHFARTVAIRDAKGLHVFRDGKCSCRDYW